MNRPARSITNILTHAELEQQSTLPSVNESPCALIPRAVAISAMAARVTDRLWEVSDLVALLEAEEAKLERAA